MTGNGTQASPYIVTNWNELAQVFPTAQYIELGNDIQAPDVLYETLKSLTLRSIDGKGYAIIGITVTDNIGCLFFNAPMILKNISFLNINVSSNSSLLDFSGSSNTIDNVVISGFANCAYLIYSTILKSSKSFGCNLHIGRGDFKLFNITNNSALGYSNIDIDYGTVVPTVDNVFTPNTLKMHNTSLKINAPSDGTINISSLNYGIITGHGKIKIPTCQNITVIEDSITLDNTSSANCISMPKSDMTIGNLYNLGFPATASEVA